MNQDRRIFFIYFQVTDDDRFNSSNEQKYFTSTLNLNIFKKNIFFLLFYTSTLFYSLFLLFILTPFLIIPFLFHSFLYNSSSPSIFFFLCANLSFSLSLSIYLSLFLSVCVSLSLFLSPVFFFALMH